MGKYLTFADELIVEHGVKFHPDTVIVDVDDVAKWYALKGEYDTPTGVCSPLFETTFLEFKTQSNVRDVPGTAECGVFAVRTTITHPLEHVTMTIVMKFRGSVFHATNVFVMDKGIVDFDIANIASNPYVVGQDKETELVNSLINCGSRDVTNESNHNYATTVAITLHALAFMRQRGQIIEVEHPHKLARNIERRTGKAPSNYYRVIPIGPGVKQYKYKTAPQTSHASPRLHSVRPHIRIVENHPLPQFNGEFFIPAHFRGQGGSEGKARKIYRVVL